MMEAEPMPPRAKMEPRVYPNSRRRASNATPMKINQIARLDSSSMVWSRMISRVGC